MRHVAKKGGVLVGFHERASSYVADMSSCEVMPAQVSELLLPLRALVGELSLRERLPQIELAAADVEGGLQIVLVLRVLQPPTADDLRRLESFARERGVEFWLQPGGPQTAVPLTAAQPQFLELVLPEFGVRLPFLPTDFTQVNHHVNAVLVSRAVRPASAEPNDRVVDFFCGLGNFTLPLARRAAQVVGYEGSATLIERARSAAAGHGLAGRTRFVAQNLFEWSLADWEAAVEANGGVDKVLIDPPREGALAVARALAAASLRPARIVYISCNPGDPCARLRGARARGRLASEGRRRRQHVSAHLARRIDRRARARVVLTAVQAHDRAIRCRAA